MRNYIKDALNLALLLAMCAFAPVIRWPDVTNEQCRAARALLDWTLDDLAQRSEVNRTTIYMFEGGRTSPRRATIKALRTALEDGGVRFLDNGEGPGVRLIRRS